MMRMPLIEFLLGGDPKFMIVLFALLIGSIIQFVKKMKTKNVDNGEAKAQTLNTQLNKLANWSLIVGVFSLLLGFMHSFYFIGKVGGIAPNLLFQGIASALITPVFGIAVAIITKLFTHIGNPKTANA